MHSKLPRHWRAIPEPYLMRDTEDRVLQGILDLLNVNGFTAQQARSLLGKLHLLIDLGEQAGKEDNALALHTKTLLLFSKC